MRAGTLRHIMTVQSLTDGQDARGGPTETPATFATILVAVEPLSGSEVFTAAQAFGTVSHRLRTRYRSGITPKMRGLIGARIFRFASVLNVGERNRELEILATEEV